MTDCQHILVHRRDGAQIAVQIAGDASRPVLLLLQGQASSHAWWTGLRRRYERAFATVTLDYRGTGGTEDPGGALCTSLLAEDAVAVLDHLGVEQADVYGTSMGGRVAQVIAAAHPHRVRTLALACTSPGGQHAAERDRGVRTSLVDPVAENRIRAMVDLFYTPAWGTDATRSHLFGDPSMSVRDRNRHLRMSAEHDAWDLLPRITAPTLVLHGEQDRMTPSSNAATIAGRITGARVHLHATGRHGFFDEFADEVDVALWAHWRLGAGSAD